MTTEFNPFIGVTPAILTPFKGGTGSIDFDALLENANASSKRIWHRRCGRAP